MNELDHASKGFIDLWKNYFIFSELLDNFSNIFAIHNNISMPEYQLTDSIITQLNAQEPWPDNVKLFQPYEVEQILLPDNASCLAVQAFLKMCNLPFEVEMRWNAEFMSPSGRVPFIKCGAFVVSELEPIVQFAANKGITLCAKLSTEEKAEMRAYMSLITNVLVNAELYISWVDNDTFNAVTKARNSSVYPWPLGWLQTRAKRNAVIKRLKALHWYEKTLDQVLSDVEQCCNSLSQRLGDKDYFFGNSPTPLDARLFGHMRAILSGQGPKAPLMIKTLTSTLLHHFLRMINVTDMKMTPQEEYLIYQAFRVSVPRFPAERTISERSTRIRSILSIKNTSRDSILSRDKDALAFKPFASKQMIIMASKEGAVTCTTSKNDKDPYRFMIEICNEIFDKVDDIISNDYSERNDYDEHNDFVVIAYPKENIDLKVSDLHTIAENDVSDVYSSEGTIEEKSATIRRDEDDIYEFHEDKKRSFSPYKKIDSSNANYSSPSELDALVFGHVFTIITTRLPCRKLADTVRKNDSLLALAKRVDEHYFKRP